MGTCELEPKALDEVIKKGGLVRLIFKNGYQCDALILDYDFDVLIVKVVGKRWLIYRNALSTIVLE